MKVWSYAHHEGVITIPTLLRSTPLYSRKIRPVIEGLHAIIIVLLGAIGGLTNIIKTRLQKIEEKIDKLLDKENKS